MWLEEGRSHPVVLEVEVVEAVGVEQKGDVGPQQVAGHRLHLVEHLGRDGRSRQSSCSTCIAS